MLRLPCDDRYRLNAGRAGSDDAYSQSGEVDPFMGPQTGMIEIPLETLQTRVIGRPGRRKIAGRHDAKPRGGGAAFIGLHRPSVCPAVKGYLVDAGAELDVAPKVEAISHMVEVAQDLGLRAIALGPMPLLLQCV